MSIYAFWNNKGGTGKTSLAFQTICGYAEKFPKKNLLVIDLCPQANLSELILGGLMGGGSDNLISLHNKQGKRKSVGGYFQDRLPSPFQLPSIDYKEYLCKPYEYNSAITENIELLAGDPIVELQSNPMATLSNTLVPGIDAWLSVIDWLKDFIDQTGNDFDDIFIDTNPSFSIYTQIALSVVNRLIIPVMADDSSRRAVQNAFSLIYGIHLPSQIYNQYAFSTKLRNANRNLPLVHLIIKNRITQYMGSASAYYSVLIAINNDIKNIMKQQPNIFTFKNIEQGIIDIRDFQTTGIVAFAEGKPFSKVSVGRHMILDNNTQVKDEYLQHCIGAINLLVDKL